MQLQDWLAQTWRVGDVTTDEDVTFKKKVSSASCVHPPSSATLVDAELLHFLWGCGHLRVVVVGG